MRMTLFAILALCALIGCQKADAPAPVETPPADAAVASDKRDAADAKKPIELPSDRCAKLDGFEKLTCADSELKRMDDELASLVARLIAHSDHNGKADVRAAQSKWQREVRNP
ncbi:MAG: hypothetical protein AAFZ58_05975, partial [Pseudomonadota bacterium]